MEGKLLQEMLLEQDSSGWRMLVGCVLLNQTSRTQVDKVWPVLFRVYPSPQTMALVSSIPRMEEMLIPLGLQRRRSRALSKFSAQWIQQREHKERREAVLNLEFAGCGEYARDSWQIFVEGQLDVEPRDKELRRYLKL